MSGELIYVFFAVLGLYVIDSYSTLLALVACGLFICCYNHIILKGCNKDRFIVSRIKRVWDGFSYIFLLWKNVILICSNIFCSRRHETPSNSSNWEHCGKTVSLEEEIDVIVFKISQYYLHPWYDKVGDNEEFIKHLKSVIKHTLLNLCSQVTKANRKKILYAALQIYMHFFIHFFEETEHKKKSEFKLDDFEMKHWAFQDNMTEWCYLQSLVSSLIDTFGPINQQNSFHSKHSPILHNFIVEILTEHILFPLSNLLCDPAQLNSWLLKILEACVDIDTDYEFASLDEEYASTVSVLYDENNMSQNISLDSEDSFKDTEAEVKVNVPYLTVSNKFCDMTEVDESETDDAITPCTKHFIKGTSYLYPFVSSGIKSSSNINLFDQDLLSTHESKSEVSSPASYDITTIKRSKSADYIRQMPQLRALNVRDYNIVMKNENNKMFVALKSDINSSGDIEQAEEAIELPTLFSDVRISDTFQQSETGFPPYTLYCIQYSGVFHDTGKPSEKPHFIKQEVSISRRFREFVALQSRLEDNPSLKNYLKGIKGPSKWLALPFSNMDKRNIAERKSFLENYLKELCNQGPIAQSSELQEFLAYGADATVAFVKKGADINVPRLDKIFIRGVKGAIDMFKTALPNTAVEGGCSSESSTPLKLYPEDSFSDHRFPEHLLEYSSREPNIQGLLKHYIKVSDISYIHHLEKCSSSDDYFQSASMLRNIFKLKAENGCQCSETWETNDENFALEDKPFGNSIIDLIIESLKFDQFNCFHLFFILKLLVSPSIDRYIVTLLDGLSEHHLALFLHILHKALWPTEKNSDCVSSNAKSKSPCNSYNVLKQYLKVFVNTSSVTMNVSYIQKLCLERIYLFLSTIQNREINRCLLFHLFDMIINIVCSRKN